MTNQTIIFCEAGVAGPGIARVTSYADHFQKDNMGTFINFEKLPIVVTPTTTPDVYWYTLQVNYNDPSIQ